MRLFLSVIAAATATVCAGSAAQAQQAAQTCMNQYADAEGVTAATLLAGGFDIKGSVPGGIWLQKGKEAYYCNSGRPADSDKAICWTLRTPVKGQTC
jgi:hypothetical protein